MKHVKLWVDDQKFASLLEALQRLDFEIIVEEPTEAASPESPTEAALTPGQKKTWATIKQGFEELKLMEQGKIKSRPLKDLLDEL